MKTAEAVKSGLPKPFPDGFFNITEGVEGNVGLVHRTYGQRKTSRVSAYGSPALAAPQQKIDQVPVKTLYSNESIFFQPSVLEMLRSMEQYKIDKGVELVAYQVREFTKRFVNAEIVSLATTLFQGSIYYDDSGNLLPTSSGATVTIDQGIPAANKNQISGIITTTWATASVDIPKNIRQIKQLSRKTTGFELEHAYYGQNIISYLQKNDYVKDWFVRNPKYNAEFLDTAEIPDGFLGIKKWHPAYQSFFEDYTETNQDLVTNDDMFVLTPEPSDEWYCMVQGTSPVASTVEVQANANAALASIKHVRGMGGYSFVSLNPVGITMIMLDNWYPFLKNPNVVFIADVVP